MTRAVAGGMLTRARLVHLTKDGMRREDTYRMHVARVWGMQLVARRFYCTL